MPVPLPILNKMKELEKQRKQTLQVRKVHGYYYLYEIKYAFDPAKGKKEVKAFYLGKITDDGTFIEGSHRLPEAKRSSSITDYLKEKTDLLKISPASLLEYPNRIDREILNIMSANCRYSVLKLAKEVGISREAAYYHIKKLTNKYNIRFTIEFASRPFDLFRYVALIKFKGKMPTREDIKKRLSSNPLIQFAATLKGNYDLFIYGLAENTKTLEDSIYDLRSSYEFSGYPGYWYVSYITYSYGFLPFRQEFFQYIKEHKVWHRTKEGFKHTAGTLTEREYNVLYELNLKANMPFKDIDYKYGYSEGSSAYSYHNLIKKGIIRRPTIILRNPYISYDSIIIGIQVDMHKFNVNRKRYLYYISDPGVRSVSKFSLVGDIGSPYGSFYITSIFPDEKLADTIKKLDLLSGKNSLEIESCIITDIIIGEIGYRRIPYSETTQSKIISEMQ
ncbi:MAG: Lrp/AsnC family transcriptional regulator [Candidatus Micrarchaeia archaeon]